ncbi:hypothetical protein [Aquimarina rubra]|uniref:Uncharacterized protein n=1 Tax=Aquimarina rubra TaxID=1920033 RepID=A0ABW5LHQ1_9FLAO
MKSLKVNFYIRVEPNGSQEPLISIQPETYNMLAHIGRGHMYSSDGVKGELEKIGKIIEGEIESYAFGGDDWCILEVKKDKTMITNGFDEFEPLEIDTSHIVKLMEDWLEFLLDYENGNIPGITHPKNIQI